MTGMKALSLCLAAGVVAACGSGDPTTGITLERVVAISDGDYLASTYADGVLPPADAGHRDLLTATSIIDGTHIATVNMRGSAFPPGSPDYDEYASVTLLRMDQATGAVTKIGDYPLRGVLPEGGAFDPTGEYFLATMFQGRVPQDPGPGIEIFRVGSDEEPGLTPVQRIPLPHGVHHVAVG
ncbi:hypothetical protein OG225_13455 [Nocardia sp. NBC_01377]|uniref:hypothetical protein n=1 Tax=Nocardia sp. NBC_01377 TaxID=2903595 RepID=UPI00324A15D4